VTSSDKSINCGSSCSGSFSSVTLTATPASGSTFAGWSGACTGTGICAMIMNTAKSVTAIFNLVPFKAVTTGVSNGIITAPIATVTTTVAFNAADKGKPQSVFVTAWAPAGTLTPAQQAKIASYTTRQMMPMGATSATTYVLVQRTSSGWQPVVNGQLLPYLSNVVGDQTAALKILDNTDTTKLLGAQFCVGYGTDQADMATAGRMQLVATVANPNAKGANTGSCNVALPISDDRLFAWVEASYPDILSGTPSPGKVQTYDYRFYPNNIIYLAIETTSGTLYAVAGGKVINAGPVENFRSLIATWEGK
jgi:hypothetical protein